MKILFLTIAWPKTGNHNIYTDLMDEFVFHGHQVAVACSAEARTGIKTGLETINGIRILHIQTGNLTQTPFIEKGISNLKVGGQFKFAIDKYFANEQFDLIIMSTPPITLSGVFGDLKKRYKAKTYLLLKDIWPQGVADIGAIKQNGLIYKYFRWQEQRLYKACDYIGCLSPANISFLHQYNVLSKKCIVEENPNSIKIRKNNTVKNRLLLRKYGIPDDKCVFIFGGNLGKPQGIQKFMTELNAINVDNYFFLFVGGGTEASYVKKYIAENNLQNVQYIQTLPKDEYEQICESADVGLVLLDGRYTIPNFPSRLLSYCENRLPILSYTDPNTDVGDIIEQAGCGIKVVRDNHDDFVSAVKKLADNKQIRNDMGNKAFKLLQDKYTVSRSYNIIMHHFESGAE